MPVAGVLKQTFNFTAYAVNGYLDRGRHAQVRAPPTLYRGASLTRNRLLLGPYRRPMPVVLGEWVFSYERGTPVSVCCQRLPRSRQARPGARSSHTLQGYLAYEKPPSPRTLP